MSEDRYDGPDESREDLIGAVGESLTDAERLKVRCGGRALGCGA